MTNIVFIKCLFILFFLPTNLSVRYLCPASEFINTDRNGFFGYPWDVYNQSVSIDVVENISPISRRTDFYSETLSFNCTAVDRVTEKHFCSSDTPCPVAQSNVDILLKATSWPIRNPSKLLKLIENIFHGTGEGVNSKIVFLGGSVTAGAATEGYCCTNQLEYMPHHSSEYIIDSRCRERHNNCMDLFKNLFVNLQGDSSFQTSWVKYFGLWLTRQKGAKLSLYNYAIRGTTSKSITDTAGYHLRKLNLTSDDLVFIDYSYNDAWYFRGPRNSVMLSSVEGLIRRILSLASASKPHIIMLETWHSELGVYPDYEYPSGASGRSKGSENNIVSYSSVYRQVAQHYGLISWSLRDVLFSEYSLLHQPFIEYMTNIHHDLKKPLHWGHPPWHTHLFWSDLYAVSLSEMKNVKWKRMQVESDHIPPPLVQEVALTSLQHCNWDKPLLINLSLLQGNGFMNAQNQSRYYAHPSGSWKYFEDRMYKPGWITDSTLPVNDKGTHSLFIPLDRDSVEAWMAVRTPSEKKHRRKLVDLVLSITFLKTYEHTQAADINLCGAPIGVLNSAWIDEKYHVSLSDTEVFAIGQHVERHCAGVPLERVALEINSPSIQHPQLNSANSNVGNYSKFKIQSITVCEVNNGGVECSFC